MQGKTTQLQIRVSPSEKAAIQRYAEEAGLDVSTYVRMRALPEPRARFATLVAALAEADLDERPYVIGELNDLLSSLSGAELANAVESADAVSLEPYRANYLAAMVELACARAKLPPPPWTREVIPLPKPFFAVPFPGLRPHLLRASPVPFKRRNLFIDATLGDRV